MTGLNRPNILVVVFDSLGEGDVATLASELPTLSGLRGDSVRFANAFAPSPESGPARASLFTGLDMAVHGVWTDGVALPKREKTFPERFAECGYETWLVGRRHLAGVSNWTTEHARPFEYSHLEWAHGPLHRSRQNAYLAWLQASAPEIHTAIFSTQPDPDDTVAPEYQREAMAVIADDLSFNTWVGSRVCTRLSEHSRGVPFLGIAGFVVGETMGAAPNKGACGERLCRGALRQADAALGQMIRRLESEGLAQETNVIVTAARGSISDPAAEHALCDTAIKVPLMLDIPGGTARSIEPAVSTMDVAPTLYDLAQIAPPIRSQGTPLTRVDGTPRGWALARLRKPGQAQQMALRTERWKLVMSHGDGDPGRDAPPSFHLFDIRADPDETDDLAGSEIHAENLEAMIDLMIDARVALEDRTEPRIAKF